MPRRPGDISSVTVLGRPLIILNSAKTAVDMLEQKSAKYSDRPVLPMGGELGTSPRQSVQMSLIIGDQSDGGTY